MGKQVYSLVLDDAVVEAADLLAVQKGMSRSALINRILAEHLSCTTPEMQMLEVFSRMEQLVSGSMLRVLSQPSESMFSLRSSIKYKYRPTLKYSVELFPNRAECIGIFRVQSRSQSESLTAALADFFLLWMQFEKAGLGERAKQIVYTTENGRFSRTLLPPVPRNAPNGSSGYPHTDGTAPKMLSEAKLGDAIAGLIKAFDQTVKAYFERLSSPESAGPAAEAVYRSYIAKSPVLL